MVCCLFSGGIIISSLFVSFSLFFDLPNEVILIILLPAVLVNSLPCFFVVLIIFLPYLLVPIFVAVFIIFLPYLSPNFLANDKKPNPFTYLL